jgi:hypothetical protein
MQQLTGAFHFSPDYGCELCKLHIADHFETATMLVEEKAKVDRLLALIGEFIADLDKALGASDD